MAGIGHDVLAAKLGKVGCNWAVWTLKIKEFHVPEVTQGLV